MDRQRPVHTLRVGRIQVAIWKNKGTTGTWFSVTSSRSYKDEQGNWKDTDSFAPQDLPLLCRLLDQAYNHLFSLERSSRGGDREDEGFPGHDVSPESWNEVPAGPA